MHIGVVNYLAGMEISTIVIANVDILGASLYDPRCEMTMGAPDVAIDQERRCIFAVNISIKLEKPLYFSGALATSDVFGFEG